MLRSAILKSHFVINITIIIIVSPPHVNIVWQSRFTNVWNTGYFARSLCGGADTTVVVLTGLFHRSSFDEADLSLALLAGRHLKALPRVPRFIRSQEQMSVFNIDGCTFTASVKVKFKKPKLQ